MDTRNKSGYDGKKVKLSGSGLSLDPAGPFKTRSNPAMRPARKIQTGQQWTPIRGPSMARNAAAAGGEQDETPGPVPDRDPGLPRESRLGPGSQAGAAGMPQGRPLTADSLPLHRNRTAFQKRTASHAHDPP